jgi:hypothetical protein
MNVRSIGFAALTLAATSAVFAEAAKPAPVEPAPAAREQTLLQDVAAGMRELLRAVAPEISLPKLEIKLPTLDANVR